MRRFLSLVLALCLLVSVCGCKMQTDSPKKPSQDEKASPKVEKREFDLVFDFVLTREDIDEFLETVEETTENVLSSTDPEYIEEALTAMDDFYRYIQDQKSIADILYCQDLTDETLRQQYLTAVEYSTEAAEAYNQSAVQINDSGTKEAKEIAFQGWTQEELDRLELYTDEVVQLNKESEELIVQYRDLPDNRFESGVSPLYKDMVDNRNQLARIYGFDNYYAYAYEVEYSRDYAPEKIETMRKYVAEYLAPICDDAYAAFADSYTKLDADQQMLVAGIVEEDYDTLDRDYVLEYLESLPTNMGEDMLYMFQQERVIFTDDENAREAAFTTSIYGEPFCFFGPGMQNTMTLVHELGHFYGLTYGDLELMPLDLAETHSQANEWLFVRHLEDVLEPETYEALLNYKLYNDIVMVVVCVLVDEFEEQVYAYENPQELTRGKLDKIADQVCEAYGGRTYINRYVVDLRSYWKHVTMETPVYYISYAVSLMVSMNAFTIAQENMTRAQRIYRSLIEDADQEAGFLGNIEEAGLTSPFEDTVYRQLYDMYA